MAEAITRGLKRLLMSQDMSDVTLIVGEQPNIKTFKVHKLLLGMGSEVFQAMFYGTMAEVENEIKFPEDDPDAFEIMITYLYLGAVDLDNLKTAISVYRVSDKYLVLELKELCFHYLSLNINADVAIDIYELSIETIDPRLEKASYENIQKNAVQIFQQSRFKEARMTTLQKILANENLVVQTEIQVYEAIVCWSKEQCRRQEEEATPGNIRQKIEPLLSGIRFLSMAADEFVKGPARDGILNETEQLLILKNILVPGSGQLPPICNSDTKGRSGKLRITYDSDNSRIRKPPPTYDYDNPRIRKPRPTCNSDTKETSFSSPTEWIAFARNQEIRIPMLENRRRTRNFTEKKIISIEEDMIRHPRFAEERLESS